MIIHDDWLFISTMKCATNSLYAALPGARYGRGFHSRPAKGERIRPLQWTVVRNPYDRAVSIWASTCLREGDRYRAKARIRSVGGEPESFDDFVAACLANGYRWAGGHGWLFRNQADWLDGVVIDRVARFSDLDADVAAIIGEVISIPAKNESEHGFYRDHYTRDETWHAVTQWAGRDLDPEFGACDP
jgi:Sulfotransferase family.